MSWPLEPAARRDLRPADSPRTEPARDDEIELSVAISLKRIADALEGVTNHPFDFARLAAAGAELGRKD